MTARERSKNMAAVKSKGNTSTEFAFIKLLKFRRFNGWRRQSKISGHPDFVFPKKKIAVFIDGCFWHGCRRHRQIPTSNIYFWKTKISNNKKRDKKVTRILKRRGWTVIRIWEHQIKSDSTGAMEKVQRAVYSTP